MEFIFLICTHWVQKSQQSSSQLISQTNKHPLLWYFLSMVQVFWFCSWYLWVCLCVCCAYMLYNSYSSYKYHVFWYNVHMRYDADILMHKPQRKMYRWKEQKMTWKERIIGSVCTRANLQLKIAGMKNWKSPLLNIILASLPPQVSILRRVPYLTSQCLLKQSDPCLQLLKSKGLKGVTQLRMVLSVSFPPISTRMFLLPLLSRNCHLSSPQGPSPL